MMQAAALRGIDSISVYSVLRNRKPYALNHPQQFVLSESGAEQTNDG